MIKYNGMTKKVTYMSLVVCCWPALPTLLFGPRSGSPHNMVCSHLIGLQVRETEMKAVATFDEPSSCLLDVGEAKLTAERSVWLFVCRLEDESRRIVAVSNFRYFQSSAEGLHLVSG